MKTDLCGFDKGQIVMARSLGRNISEVARGALMLFSCRTCQLRFELGNITICL